MKKILRAEIIKKRQSMTEMDFIKNSNSVFNNIVSWQLFKDKNNLMLYYSFRNEVDTLDIIEECFRCGKNVILPKTIKETTTILPCKIDSVLELIKGEYGIMEPPEKEIFSKNNIDIIFVPGVAFDKRGYRIGYGAGYYDRFLRDFKGIKVGMCFEFQVLDDVFPEEHDVSMDYLITERGIINTGDV
ncbi:5-formyltetrahydrofolate cyclo-ligase [Fervidicella metallireducens AeB]|uniref:5-formyltetrahydrofolate cyclo-ligase n=1 Tax=Fervidicella metallireducens AeB TaxID=1403537 RepID=A0A017RZ42_9CLOT|nr:5-formyltetrahydrofolate cyclo-ligase [Fervidicella metallireducens]EYE89205.1 5-formyltetrahydrofolate cyclo-ligase [Fervidicella metallireducens AeB]